MPSYRFVRALPALALVTTLALTGCAASEISDADGDAVNVATTHSAEDRGRVIQACLTEKGFPATIQEDGSLLTNTPSEQIEERQAAGQECMDEALDQYPMPVENEEFKKTLYAEEVDTVECLAGHGVVVVSLPSIQTYVETYSGPDRWSAWADVTPDTQPQLFEGDLSALKALELACPNPLSRY